MRQIVLPIIVGLLFILSACEGNSDTGLISASPNENLTSGIVETQSNQKDSPTTDEMQATSVDDNISFSFASVEEMLSAFESAQDQPHMSGSINGINDSGANVLESIVEQGIAGVPVPMYGDADLPLRNVSGLDNVVIEPNSVFEMPLIWYYAELDGSDIIISTGVLPSEQLEQIGNGGIAALKELQEGFLATLPEDPNATEVSVTTNQTELFIDGITIPAVITQYSTDPRYHVEFITDDSVYVKIYIYPEDYNRGILTSLSFITEPINEP